MAHPSATSIEGVVQPFGVVAPLVGAAFAGGLSLPRHCRSARCASTAGSGRAGDERVEHVTAGLAYDAVGERNRV